MKITVKTRIMVALLALLMLCSVACATPSADDPADTTTAAAGDSGIADDGDVSTTPADTTTAAEGPDLPDVDYTGQSFIFLEREIEEGNNVNVYFNEIFGDISTAETMSTAAYNRNMAVSDKYGVEIVSIRKQNSELASTFTKASDAGDKLCDVIHANGANTMKLATQGYIRDVNTIEHLDFSNPWWMGMAMETSSIAGKNAFAIGDTNSHAFTAVSAVFFNKQMVVDLDLENIYQVVEDGKWTIDKMRTYCEAAVSDLNGDGAMDNTDRYGMIFNNYAWAPFFYGSGRTLVQKDTNDAPYIAIDDETTLSVLAKTMDFLADDTLHACSAWISMDGGMEPGFQDGHSMFYVQLMYATMALRRGDLEFGILPTPKTDENQDDYYSYIHNKSSYTAVPKINQDIEKTGILLEAMAYESYKTVRPDFFDIMLDGKVARDEESTEMLDIIYKNMYVCLLQPMGGIGLDTDTTMRGFISSKTGSSSFSSTFARTKNVWGRKLNQIVADFESKMDE